MIASIRLQPCAGFDVLALRFERASNEQVGRFVLRAARYGRHRVRECARKISRALGAAGTLQVAAIVRGVELLPALEGSSGCGGAGARFAREAANGADSGPNLRAVRVLGVSFQIGFLGLLELTAGFMLDPE